jgi:hypothetical protein
MLWTALFVAAMTGERAGGTLLWALLIAAVGLIGVAVLGAVLLFHLALVKPTSLNWAERCETIVVAAMWVFVLLVLPSSFVGVAVAGKDVTLFC